MDNEPEVTRAQMQETRTALSEKLETLEHKVVDTVQGATHAVHETVDHVKEAMHETVENVKDTFNLPLQVKRHPWGMVAGSIALGYLGGYLLFRNRPDQPRVNGGTPPAHPDSLQLTRQVNGVANGHRSAEEAGVNHLFESEITKLKGLVIG